MEEKKIEPQKKLKEKKAEKADQKLLESQQKQEEIQHQPVSEEEEQTKIEEYQEQLTQTYSEQNIRKDSKKQQQARATYWFITAFVDMNHDRTTFDCAGFSDTIREAIIAQLVEKFTSSTGIRYIYLTTCLQMQFQVFGWMQLASIYQTYFTIFEYYLQINNKDIVRVVIELDVWKKYPYEQQQLAFEFEYQQIFVKKFNISNTPFQFFVSSKNVEYTCELSTQQRDKFLELKKVPTDMDRYKIYTDNIELSTAPLMMYLQQRFRVECLKNGIKHVFDNFVRIQEDIRKNIQFNPLETKKDFKYYLPDYIRNSKLPWMIQITEWFDKYCTYPLVKSKCLVLYSEKRNMGKTSFAKSLVSPINPDGTAQDEHRFTIVTNHLTQTQFKQSYEDSRLLIFDDLQSFDDINKNQEQWKSVLTSQKGVLRGLYLAKEWEGKVPVIITTNNIKFVSYLKTSSMFSEMCYRVDVQSYLGPPGTEPTHLSQLDTHQVTQEFEDKLDNQYQLYIESKRQKNKQN